MSLREAAGPPSSHHNHSPGSPSSPTPTRGGRLSLAGLVATLAAFVLACASDSQEAVPVAVTLEAATERGAFGVGVTSFELVDSSRPTEQNRDFPGADERTLGVELWYPADPSAMDPEEADAVLDRGSGPYPLIVFAHGLGSGQRQSVTYTQHLASHGYIVAAPNFPLSRMGAPGGATLGAVLNQPADVSFLIDSLLALSDQDGHLLHDAIDGEAIGITGHSLGALTTILTIYGPSRDPRVLAGLAIAVPGCFLGNEIAADTSVPVLILGGSNDLITPPPGNRWAYEVANPPRYLVELTGADHTRFADVPLTDTQILEMDLLPGAAQGDLVEDAARLADALGGDIASCEEPEGGSEEELVSPERQRELLRAFATPFFDAYLRDSDAAERFLEEELPGLIPEARAEFEPE